MRKTATLSPAASPHEPLWTPAEACGYLSLTREDGSPNTNRLYLLRSRYGLPALRLGGQLRFRRSDIERWLEERSKLAQAS